MQPVLSDGPRCYLILDGNRLGEAISFSYEVNNQVISLDGIDSTVPSELATTRSHITGNVELYRIVNGGGLEGKGLATTPERLSRLKYSTLSIQDALTGYYLFTCYYVLVSGQKWQWAAKELCRGNFSFSAISYCTEAASSSPV